MDYYQGVVIDYLRANRAVFVNSECCIQLNPSDNPDSSGPHWFCDAVAVDFEKSTVSLCEISYAKALGALMKRLAAWNLHWEGIKAALTRDCHLRPDWPVEPWIFIPRHCLDAAHKGIERALSQNDQNPLMPYPKITFLEDVAPWKYASWNRRDHLLGGFDPLPSRQSP